MTQVEFYARWCKLGKRVHRIYRKIAKGTGSEAVIDALRETGAILREGREPFVARPWPRLAAQTENLAHDFWKAIQEAKNRPSARCLEYRNHCPHLTQGESK